MTKRGMVKSEKSLKTLLTDTMKIVLIDKRLRPMKTLKTSLVPVCLMIPL